jgi:hypothetical protein
MLIINFAPLGWLILQIGCDLVLVFIGLSRCESGCSPKLTGIKLIISGDNLVGFSGLLVFADDIACDLRFKLNE